jgi:ATP/ADP translocase
MVLIEETTPENKGRRFRLTIKPVARSLYGFFAVIFLIVGVSVLSLRIGLLPDFAKSIVMNAAHEDLNAAHLIQEFGSMLVFASLISVWFIRRYEQSKFFHWAMTTFWALFSLAHWFDVRGRFQSMVGPAINTLPFLLFVVVGLLRKSSEKRSDSDKT